MITYFISKIKKKLIKGLSGKAGRNNLGRVCVRGQGGGLKKKYRLIDIFRRLNSTGKVIKVFYDSNRTGRIALVLYLNSFCSFLLLQKGVKVNSVVYSGTLLCDNISMGYSMPLQHMPLFANISNLELIPFIGSTLCRAAGTSCMLVGKLKKETEGIIKLKSG